MNHYQGYYKSMILLIFFVVVLLQSFCSLIHLPGPNFFSYPQTLENWDATDPESLLNLIKELVIQYKEHQKRQVKEIPRIEFEYSTLEADTKYPEFEVHVIKGQQVGNS